MPKRSALRCFGHMPLWAPGNFTLITVFDQMYAEHAGYTRHACTKQM